MADKKDDEPEGGIIDSRGVSMKLGRYDSVEWTIPLDDRDSWVTDKNLEGLIYKGPITLTLDFGNQPPSPALTCKAEPCSWCGACNVCGDYHAHEPWFVPCRGCTDQTCPFQKDGDEDE